MASWTETCVSWAETCAPKLKTADCAVVWLQPFVATKMEVDSGSESSDDPIPLRGWRRHGFPQVGWWIHVGRVQLDGCLTDYVPINMSGHLLPEYLRDRYWALNIPSTRYKENFHKQLWMDLNGLPVPHGRELHHINHNRWDNRSLNLELLRVEDHRRHQQEELKKVACVG